jgi:hypothetical protein
MENVEKQTELAITQKLLKESMLSLYQIVWTCSEDGGQAHLKNSMREKTPVEIRSPLIDCVYSTAIKNLNKINKIALAAGIETGTEDIFEEKAETEAKSSTQKDREISESRPIIQPEIHKKPDNPITKNIINDDEDDGFDEDDFLL